MRCEKRGGGLETSAKRLDPGQLAQSAQADLGKFFFICVNFLRMKGQYYLIN